MRRISDSQARTLRNAMRGDPLTRGIHGRSAFGGFNGTMFSLRKLGYLDEKEQITKLGIEALAYYGDDEALKWVEPKEPRAPKRKRKRCSNTGR